MTPNLFIVPNILSSSFRKRMEKEEKESHGESIQPNKPDQPLPSRGENEENLFESTSTPYEINSLATVEALLRSSERYFRSPISSTEEITRDYKRLQHNMDVEVAQDFRKLKYFDVR